MTNATTLRTTTLRLAMAAGAAISLAGGCAHDPGADRQARVDRQQAIANEAAKAPLKPEPPATAKTHFAAGQVAEGQADLDRAIDQYKQAVAIDPTYQPALFRLGMAQAAGRQYDAAILTWRQYVTATGGSAAAYADLGFCLDLAGRGPQADAAFKAGVAADPRNAPCRTNYGLMLARAGKLDAATVQLAAVLTPAEVQYDLASVLENQGRRDEAKARFAKALQLDPNMADAKARLTNLQ